MPDIFEPETKRFLLGPVICGAVGKQTRVPKIVQEYPAIVADYEAITASYSLLGIISAACSHI